MRIQALNSLLEKRFRPAESRKDCDDFFSWSVGELDDYKAADRIIVLMNNKTNFAIILRGIKRTSYSPNDLIENEIRITLLEAGIAPDTVNQYITQAGAIYYNIAAGSSQAMKQVKSYLAQAESLKGSLVKCWHQTAINAQINSDKRNSIFANLTPMEEMIQALRNMTGRDVIDSSAAFAKLEEMKDSIALHIADDVKTNKKFTPPQEQAPNHVPKLKTIGLNTLVLPSSAKVANNAGVFIRKRPFRMFEHALDLCTTTGKFIAFVSASDSNNPALKSLPYGKALKGTIVKVSRKNAVEMDLAQLPFQLPDYLIPPNTFMQIPEVDVQKMQQIESQLDESGINIAKNLIPNRIHDENCEKLRVGMVLPVTYGFSSVTVKDLDALSESFRTEMREEPVLSHQFYLNNAAIGDVSSLINGKLNIETNPLFFEIVRQINAHPDRQLVALIKRIEQKLAFRLDITVDLVLVPRDNQFASYPPEKSVRMQNGSYYNYDESYETQTLANMMSEVSFDKIPKQNYDELMDFDRSKLTIPILYHHESRYLILNYCSISQDKLVYLKRDQKAKSQYVGKIL